MKKLGLLIVLLIVTVSFSGCTDPPDPDERAESYLTFSELFKRPEVTAYILTDPEAWYAQTQKREAYDKIVGLDGMAVEAEVKLYERHHLGIDKDFTFLCELQKIYHNNKFCPEGLRKYKENFDIKDTGLPSTQKRVYYFNYDHIAVELHFMHYLAEKGKNGNLNTESDQKNFFNNHLKNWLIGTPSFTEECKEFYIEEELKNGELNEWDTYYYENIQLLEKFIESESIRFENMDSPAGTNSIDIYNQPSSLTISSTNVYSEVISMNHGNYIGRTIDSNYQITNLEVPENLQFLSVSIISTDVSTGFELQLWDPHGRLRGARDATARKSTILIPKTDEMNIYGGTWEIVVWKNIESDFNYIISTGEIFSEYTIPVAPIKDTDFTFHLVGENPEWLEMNSISGTIELTLPDGIIGESKKTVQIDSGEIEDIVFSLHANEIGKQTITVTAEIKGYPYSQYVDINIIDENDEFTPLDLCMVLDRSGSMDNPMGDKKKIQGAKEAATDVVDVLMPQDRVSLISFSSTATTDIDFTNDFSAVKIEINQLSADGWTSFGAGLQAALNQFNANGNPDHIPAILFMSDGVHNTAPDPDAFVTECKNKEIPIFTVGFASSESEVDVARLRNMADETGGEYLFADDIFKLQNIFIELQHKASGWESEATYTGEVNQGQTVTAGSFDIAPSTKNSRITLNWPGSDLDLKLLNPDGIPVNFSAPDIIYSGDTKPEYVILKEPQPGTWTVRVYGKVVDSSEDYYVLVTEYVPPGSQICKTQITSDPSPQDRPSIVNANGDYYVAYQSWETGSSYNGDIFIKKYDSKWNEVKKQQITDNSYYQDSPSLVFANNELYVALITNHEGATWDDYDVYLKKYDSNLNYISGSGRYLTTSQSCQDLPSLFYKDGYFYLTYSSWESGSSYNGDIYIKKFDSSWNQIKKVRITSETSLQTRPSVIYANGYFYIVYYSKETGNRDIFVKRLDANLNLDSWKKQITSESSSQSFPSISFANNEYAIVYASYETGTIGIYMKKYDINWNFIEKTKLVDESSAQERRPSHIWDGSNYLVSYVHNYTANDDWNIFTMIPGCNEGQLSQTIPLQVSVSETPDSVTSGETSQVTVHVTSSADGLPVQGASVMVSVIGGSVTPTSGTTDGNGDIKLTYHAPTVTSPTICLISATTSKTGYASGSGSDTIVVNPQGGQTTYSIPLHTGWNLISIPLVPEDSNIDSVFSSIAGNYGVVWTTTSTGGWKSSNQAFGRLTDITVDKGYLIYMTAPDTLVIEGTEPASTIINLASGWNLVGYPSQTTRSITDVLSGVSYGVVWTTTSTGGWKSSNQAFGRLTDMSPGNGYMLYAPVSGSYTVN